MPGKKKSKPTGRKSGAKKRAEKSQAPASKKASAINAPAAVLDSEKLKELYSTMLKCRMLSEKLRGHSTAPLSKSGSVVPGKEAMLVGAAAHALPQDSILAEENDSLVAFLRGVPLERLLAQLLSAWATKQATRVNGSSAQPVVSRGVQLGRDIKGQGKAALVFCREASADELGRAAKDKLPLVCLTETTLSELAVAQSRHSAASEPNMGFHFPRIAVDGTDVVAVFRVAQEAVRRARGGHGPSLIQCVMPEESSERGKTHDPLSFMERYLRRKKLWASDWQRGIADEFRRELDPSFKAAEEQIQAGSISRPSSL